MTTDSHMTSPRPAERPLREATINALLALFPTSFEDDWLGTQSLTSHLLEALSVDPPLDMTPARQPPLDAIAAVATELGLECFIGDDDWQDDSTGALASIAYLQCEPARLMVSPQAVSIGDAELEHSPAATKAILLALVTASASAEAARDE